MLVALQNSYHSSCIIPHHQAYIFQAHLTARLKKDTEEDSYLRREGR